LAQRFHGHNARQLRLLPEAGRRPRHQHRERQQLQRLIGGRLANRKGFAYVETLQLELSAMPGAKQKHGKHKHEPIFVFKKK
jgi:hypothetical protein